MIGGKVNNTVDFRQKIKRIQKIQSTENDFNPPGRVNFKSGKGSLVNSERVGRLHAQIVDQLVSLVPRIQLLLARIVVHHRVPLEGVRERNVHVFVRV